VGKVKSKKKAFADDAAPLKEAPPRRIAHESPVQRLRRHEHIDIWEHTAADEIVAAYQLSIGLPVSRDADLGIPRGDLNPNGADAAAARRSDILVTYQKWRAELAGTAWLSVAMDVLFAERQLHDIDAARQQRKGTARGVFIAAIRHFAAMRGNIPPNARDWKLTVK
jgi:hypothetical protein